MEMITTITVAVGLIYFTGCILVEEVRKTRREMKKVANQKWFVLPPEPPKSWQMPPKNAFKPKTKCPINIHQ